MGKEHSMDQVFIKKLIDILELNLEKEHFGVKELIQESGISRSQVHRKLFAITGKSTSRFIREFRLRKAHKLLENNVATASEISYQVGFSSPTYFNSCFHKYYGYTPGEVKFRIPSENEGEENSIEDLSANPRSNNSLLKNLTSKQILISITIILVILTIAYDFYTDSNVVVIQSSSSIKKKNISIAVLPFKNLSDEKSNQYFADGVMDVISNHLSSINEFHVFSGTTMERYRNNPKSPLDIYRELGVSYILKGSVQKENDSVRVIVQLIDAQQDKQLWSNDIKKKFADIFTLQSQIAKHIASELKITLSPTQIKVIDKKPTKNLEAYNIYLQAEFQRNKFNESAFLNAIPLYEQAINLDSNFIKPYIGLISLWGSGGTIWGIYKEQEAWSKIKNLLLRAVKFDSTNVRMFGQLYSGYFYYEWNFDINEKNIQENKKGAAGKNKGRISVDYLIKTGRYEEALDLINKRISNSPHDGPHYTFKAEILNLMGKKYEAMDLLSPLNPLYSDNLFYLRQITKLYYNMGEYEKFQKYLDKIMLNFNDRPPIILWFNLLSHELNNNETESQKFLDELIIRYYEGTSGSPAWFIALYYCTIKDSENAYKWLQNSYDNHEVEMTWLKEELLLIPLHNDWKYKKLYNKIGFPEKN